jgi:diguanylate cyclase (GGDEF)-like protein
MQCVTLAMIVVTAGLLWWHRVGMVRVLEVSARSGHLAQPRDDRGDGGTSRAVPATGDAFDITCTLEKSAYRWPYCGLHLQLGDGAAGVDLSVFDQMTIAMAHAGPGEHSMRAYIRNFERDLSNVADYRTQKVNEIEFTMPASGTVTIPLGLYRAAAWWNAAMHVPLLRTGPNVDNATAIELYTGSLSEMGTHRLRLESVRFEGKWISQRQLALALVCAWCLYGAAWLVLGLFQYRSQLRSEKARVATLTVINAALQLESRQLADQVVLDPLTGALNRQGLREALLKDDDSEAGCHFDALLFIDLDHFKQINDRCGHEVGDRVLKQFAAVASAMLRESDRLVRWGGEEFLILCAGIGADNAAALARQLCDRLAHTAWPDSLRVTASIGVSAIEGAADMGAAIGRADQALYLAKRNGRNRVEAAVYPHDGGTGSRAA